ncbi:cupin domain-containing protein [Candidatus Eisenbacteria bacterium]|uniref:Cupin domain-containing protein n=1 Tax=Eiseniibacteriota bacterium TaxID=2212470 RepID=A0ABV6YNT1_UNCEI
MDVSEIKKKLGLKPLMDEGGYFSETYRSGLRIPGGTPAGSAAGGRSLATAIYYLLTPETFSALHRLASDEIYHFYLGDPVEMLLLDPDGSSDTVVIGSNMLQDMRLQTVVPAGVWQGSRLMPGGEFALMGTTMAPGFDPADFELGGREELVGRYPEARDLIIGLTR